MHHDNEFRVGRRPGVCGAVFLAVTTMSLAPAWADEPPDRPATRAAMSEKEQERWLQKIQGLVQEAQEFEKAGRLDEAVDAVGRALKIVHKILGDSHEEFLIIQDWLARLHEAREDWAAARRVRSEVLELWRRQPGAKSWQVTDARLALSDVELRAALDGAQRQRLGEADRLEEHIDKLYAQGRGNEAVDEAIQLTVFRKDVLGKNHPDYAMSLHILGSLYRDKGDYAKAEPLYLEAREVYRKAVGEAHPDYARVVNNLAMLDLSRGRYVAAARGFRQALKIWEEVWGKRHPDYVLGLNNLAVVSQTLGENARAESYLLESLEICAAISGKTHPDYARGLNNLAMVYQAKGDHARAEANLLQVLEIWAKLPGKDTPTYAVGLQNLAMVYRAKGDFGKAESLLGEALATCRKVLRRGHPDYLTILNNLGEVYREKGEYSRAESLNKETLVAIEAELGRDHPHYARGLNNLAELYQATGDYARAESLLRQALAVHSRNPGKRHPLYALSLNNLAHYYETMGDHERAASLYLEALEVMRTTVGPDHPDYALSLSNLGALYQKAGLREQADRLLRRALKIYEDSLGKGHPDYARVLNNLAELYRAAGEYGRAEPLYREALRINEKVRGKSHPESITILNNLAALYWAEGDYGQAEPLYREALAAVEAALGKGHPDYARGLANLAALYQIRGEYDRAEPLVREALGVMERIVDNGFASLGERQRLRLLGSHRIFLDCYLSVAIEAGVPLDEVYQHLTSWKGAVFARQAEDRILRRRPELEVQFKQLRQVNSGLVRVAFENPASAQLPAWRRRFDELRSRKEDLEADLAQRSAEFRDAARANSLKASDVAKALPPGMGLVDFVTFINFEPPAVKTGHFLVKRQFLAFVLRKDRPIACVRLKGGDAITAAIRDWRRGLDVDHEQGQADPEAIRSAPARLRKGLWEPILAHLDGLSTVLIAPDGELARFPFAALPGSRPGSYLIEDLAIGYVNSGRQLVELTKAEAPDGAGLLAVGGVDFQADPGKRSPTDAQLVATSLLPARPRGGFGELKATGPEVSRAGADFKRYAPGQAVKILTGAEATEAALKARLKGHRWRVLHLATHGFFAPPAYINALRKTDNVKLARLAGHEADARGDFVLTPLLRSGVALAGAGRGPGDDLDAIIAREDGLWMAEEVLLQDLSSLELVVLSACETGLGELERGEGVMGLQRAFHAAGARAVAASLWKVDDAATSVLMEHFYDNLWRKKMPKLEALRQAQLAVLNDPAKVERRQAQLDAERAGRGVAVKAARRPIARPGGPRSSPVLWAAFVLSGDVR